MKKMLTVLRTMMLKKNTKKITQEKARKKRRVFLLLLLLLLLKFLKKHQNEKRNLNPMRPLLHFNVLRPLLIVMKTMIPLKILLLR